LTLVELGESIESAVDSATIIGAAVKSRPRRGQWWVNGPVCFSGEHKQYVADPSAYLAWIGRVERALGDSAASAQRIRLLYHGARAGNRLFDEVLNTTGSWASASLTTDVLPQGVLDALMRTGYVRVDPSTMATPRTLVDVTHLWPALDAHMNGLGALGKLLSVRLEPIGVLTWTGDLGSLWDEYNTRRLAAKQTKIASGATWSEDPTDLTKPFDWLNKSKPTRCPVEDLLGDMDAIAVTRHENPLPSGHTPLTDRLADYYLKPPGDSADRKRLHSDNRFHLFVRLAVPRIPHTTSPNGEVTLAETAERVIREHVERVAFWLVYKARLGNPWTLARYVVLGPPGFSPVVGRMTVAGRIADAVRRGVKLELESAWGKAVLNRIAKDFTEFLQQGLKGDGWTIGKWPTIPSPLADYGGYRLTIGDSDKGGRYGGESHSQAAHVATLQQRLLDCGFAVVGTADGDFGPRTATAVREFQIEASQDRIWARTLGPSVSELASDAIRRYHGPVHGLLDWETAFALEHWDDTSGTRRDELDRAGRGIDRIINPIRVESRADGKLKLSDVWRFDEEKNMAHRLWAIDRIERYEVPAEDAVPGAPGMAYLGRYQGGDRFNGPVSSGKELWRTARIRLHHFFPPPLAANHADKSRYRVIRAVAQVECIGQFDSVNAYDVGRVSLGMYHWALQKYGVGELAAFLAFYKGQDPAAYQRDFGRYGIEPEKDWDSADWNGAGAHAQAKYAGRIKLHGLRDASGTVHEELRPLSDRTSPNGVLIDDYLVDWLRSWRSLHRILMSLRLSVPLQRAQWPFALLRVETLLKRDWAPAGNTTGPFVTVYGSERRARFGEVFTSEQAVACLLRWHVNRPGQVLNSQGATRAVQQAYEKVYGTGKVDLSAITESEATDRQRQLVDNLVSLAPGEWFRKSVEQVRDYGRKDPGDPDVGPLSPVAGSFRRLV
jgi:peptidoglycan hydrolase-like protein with peptidoglycan-binding domain